PAGGRVGRPGRTGVRRGGPDAGPPRPESLRPPTLRTAPPGAGAAPAAPPSRGGRNRGPLPARLPPQAPADPAQPRTLPAAVPAGVLAARRLHRGGAGGRRGQLLVRDANR